MKFRSNALPAVLLVLSGLLVAGCASVASTPRPPEEVVLQRAQARWNALAARNWADAYQYLTSGYRAIVPQERYGNQFQGPVQWEGAKAKSAKCTEKRCVVDVEIAFRALLPGRANQKSSTYYEEIWVLEDEQWFKFEPI